MTKREALRLTQQENTLLSLGFTREEAEQLRRISMTLHAWHERECGTDGGCIERDDATQKPYWLDSRTMRRHSIADREKGARKRLATIFNTRNARVCDCGWKEGDDTGHETECPSRLPVTAYVQTDPRGAALYILRPGDVPDGQSAGSYYTRGLCIY